MSGSVAVLSGGLALPKHTLILLPSPEVTIARQLRTHLRAFLAPLLGRLATQLGVRLVQTSALVVEGVVRLRQRSQALWLTEIGTLLLGVARLLASANWAAAVEQWS